MDVREAIRVLEDKNNGAWSDITKAVEVLVIFAKEHIEDDDK